MILVFVFLLLILSPVVSITNGETLPPTRLLNEYIENPIGLDIVKPRLSWVMNDPDRGEMQTAYQIIVGTSKENLDDNYGDIWDSRKVLSGKSVNIPYDGSILESGKTYYWKVRTWDKDGQVSSYSKVASFGVALLDQSEWQGKWIGGGNLLRKSFIISKDILTAKVYVSGIGYYELRINGKKIGDQVLDPNRTNYRKRVLYNAFDITNNLIKGGNAIGIMLGNGWYTKEPRAILQLNIEFTDKTSVNIYTDKSWKCADGPIVENSIYNGEIYDARLEKPGWDTGDYDDSSWKSALPLDSPGGKLVAQIHTPIKVVQTIIPVALTNPKKDVWVCDMGQNMTGWSQLAVEGPEGTRVTLQYSELLYEEGTVNKENLRDARCTDRYILKGKGIEIYEPRFTYHGFRYVQITGFPGTPTIDNFRGRVVHSAVSEGWLSSFTCSNSMINRIQKLIYWSQLSNLFGYPMDCPQRDERQGWAGDAHVSAEEAIYNFNMASLYNKWINDLKFDQGEDGGVPDVSPVEPGTRLGDIGSNDPPWDSVYNIMVWYMYLYYDDKRILEEHYQNIKKYVEHLRTIAEDNIVSKGRYGDWIAPERTPQPLISTGYYYYDTKIVSEVAQILGYNQDAVEYSKLSDEIETAFNKEFFDPVTDKYGNGSAYSYVWPLFLGIVPENKKKDVVRNLINHITDTWKGHISTGTLGTKYIFDVLTKNYFLDVAYNMVNKETYPSWGYMLSHDATTLWELWEYRTGDRMNSHNHIMLGSMGEWFYKSLAGIQMVSSAPGFRKAIIKPYIVGNLNYVEANVQTIRGIIYSEWRRNGNELTLNITIPCNCESKIYIPLLGTKETNITESNNFLVKNGKFTANSSGIIYSGIESDYAVFEVGSGSYKFKMYGKSLWDKE